MEDILKKECMLAVFCALFGRPEMLCKNRTITKAERNAALLQKAKYNYVYTPISGFFLC